MSDSAGRVFSPGDRVRVYVGGGRYKEATVLGPKDYYVQIDGVSSRLWINGDSLELTAPARVPSTSRWRKA